jgi:hypothetical protein
LLSGPNGFQDSVGALDGLDTGVPGSGAYTTTFTVAASTAATLSIPDFMFGPGQTVNYAIGGTGIPLTLTNAAGLTSLTFHINYDPTLLTITGASTVGAPAGSTLIANLSTPGHATFTFTVASALGSGSITIGAITATVPSTAVYGTRQILTLGVDSATGATAIGDNALEVVGFLGDTDGNAKYDTGDGPLVQQVVVGTDSGFSAWPDVDPLIIANVIRYTSLATVDATRLNQEAATQARPEFAPLPSSPVTVNPTVLVTGLPPAVPGSVTMTSGAGVDAASVSLDAFATGDASTDSSDWPPKSHLSRIKLAKPFADFALTPPIAAASWKRGFMNAPGAGRGNVASNIRVTL